MHAQKLNLPFQLLKNAFCPQRFLFKKLWNVYFLHPMKLFKDIFQRAKDVVGLNLVSPYESSQMFKSFGESSPIIHKTTTEQILL